MGSGASSHQWPRNDGEAEEQPRAHHAAVEPQPRRPASPPPGRGGCGRSATGAAAVGHPAGEGDLAASSTGYGSAPLCQAAKGGSHGQPVNAGQRAVQPREPGTPPSRSHEPPAMGRAPVASPWQDCRRSAVGGSKMTGLRPGRRRPSSAHRSGDSDPMKGAIMAGRYGRLAVWRGRFGLVSSAAWPWPRADRAAAPTFSKDVAPIFQAKCQACHQPDSIAPMSLITYQEARPWARVDQGARRRAPDAAVAHRPQRRRPEVQERHVAHRRADRHDRPLGRSAARRRAIRRTCRRPSRSSTDNEWQGVTDGFGPPDLVIKSAEYTMPARAPGRVVAADERHPDHRAALGEDGRDSSDEPEGAQDPAPLDRVPRAQPEQRRRRSTPARPAGAAAAVDAGRPRQPPSAADGMGDRQGLRPVPRRHRQADRAGREDLVGPAHPRRRRRDHGRLGDRHLVLPERPGAEEAQLPDRLHRPQERHASASTSRRTRSRTPKASRC